MIILFVEISEFLTGDLLRWGQRKVREGENDHLQ